MFAILNQGSARHPHEPWLLQHQVYAPVAVRWPSPNCLHRQRPAICVWLLKW